MSNIQDLISLVPLPDIQDTVPEVFILESLDWEDERDTMYEGRVLSEMLKLAGKDPKYYYFQSVKELPYLIGLFRQSKYRYLHISTHASTEEIAFTNGRLKYNEFAEYFAGHLKLRRLFFSACEVGNSNFVDAIASKNRGMHSILAPMKKVGFGESAASWSAMYMSLFGENAEKMKRADIEKRIRAITLLFPIDYYFAPYDSVADKWHYNEIRASIDDK